MVLFYLFMSGAGWFVMFCYEFDPVLFVWLNVVCLASFMFPAIFFYRIIRFLTRLGQPEDFHPLHYAVPGVLMGVMLVWSSLVPFEVQLEIVRGKARVFPDGYEMYARFFTIKPLARVAFGLAYYLLAIRVLVKYYRKATGKQVYARKRAKWVLFLVGISLASLFSSVLPTFMPRGEILYSAWTLMVALCIASQHVLLSYHVIRRDYLLYVMKEAPPQLPRPVETEAPSPGEPVAKPSRRQYAGKLDRDGFERFISEEKPYLDPGYKITDMVEDLDVNRTAISVFVNRTYGVNFNRYLNRLRLRELDRLRSLPEGQGKTIGSLIDKAGFKDYRNYSRAAAAEREEKGGEG